MQVSGKNIIGFKESSLGTNKFQTFNPKENKLNNTFFFDATNEEVEEAMTLANDAFPLYYQKPVCERILFLKRVISLLLENQETLIQQYIIETGLSKPRGESELKRTCVQIESFLKVIEADNWPIQSEETTSDGVYFQKRFSPLGPVIVFGASNFPFAYSTTGGDSASALAAGCPVVVKSHPMHAGTGYLVSKLISRAAQETGMPSGVFSNLNANNHLIGELLVKHPFTKAVAFTGSIKGGMALVEYAQSRVEPIPVFCEMGSLNPVFLFPSAIENKSEEIVEELTNAITDDSGQFCTKPGMIFLIDDEKSKLFIEMIFEQINLKTALPMLGPSIFKNFEDGYQVETRLKALQSRESKPENFTDNLGLPILQVISLEVFESSSIWQEEVFGPYSLLILCNDTTDFKKVSKLISGQLTASIWADFSELIQQDDLLFELQRKVGRVIFNGVPTGVQVIDSMHHGGSFPSTSDSRFTAVGKDAIYRFLKAISFQGFPKAYFDKKP